MNVFLVRHGESEGNKQQLLFGRTDYPLTELGKAQASTAGNKIENAPFSLCYSSPLIRASETASICLNGRDIPVIYEDALMEQDMGDWEGCDFDTVMSACPDEFGAMMSDWIHSTPKGGESFDQMYARVTGFIDKLLADEKDVLIVGHNGSLSIITSYLLGGGKNCVEGFYHHHGCYTHIIVGGKFNKTKNTLVCFNK